MAVRVLVDPEPGFFCANIQTIRKKLLTIVIMFTILTSRKIHVMHLCRNLVIRRQRCFATDQHKELFRHAGRGGSWMVFFLVGCWHVGMLVCWLVFKNIVDSH